MRLRRLGLPPPLPLLLKLFAYFLDRAAYLDPAPALSWRGFCPVVCPPVYHLHASLPYLVDVYLWLGRLFPRPPPPATWLRSCCICLHVLEFALMACVTKWSSVFTAFCRTRAVMYKSIGGVSISFSSTAVRVLLYAPSVRHRQLFYRTCRALKFAVGITRPYVSTAHSWAPYIIAGRATAVYSSFDLRTDGT